jgi:hypothetical protein
MQPFNNTNVMAKKKLLEDIKGRPSRFYRMPADVLRDRRFGDPERLEILRAWMTVAEDEATARQLGVMIAEMERRPANDHAAE